MNYMYTISEAIMRARERYGYRWFELVTLHYDRTRGYVINIAHGPRA